MTNVTVQGSVHTIDTLAYDLPGNANLAAQIASAISSAVLGGTLKTASNSSGPVPPLPPGATGLFVQNIPGVTTLTKGYNDVVNNAASAIIFGDGGTNENILSGAGNLTFYATGGSGSIVTGAGNNVISIPVTDTGNWLIETGGGNDSIVDRGTGSDTIGAGPGANGITLGGGIYHVTSVGMDTITAGSGATTIDASGSPGAGGGELVFAGNGTLVFVGGASPATIFGGGGGETVTGGSGALYAQGGAAGNNSLTAGTGTATLFGGGSGDVLTANGTLAQALYAGAGNETLFGGSATGADTFSAGPGRDQLTGGLGADTYVGSSGQATVNALGSSNVFQFVGGHAGGTMLVNDLTNASQVSINLSAYGPSEAANAVAGQTTNGNSVTITLSDSTVITFENITHLTGGNFS